MYSVDKTNVNLCHIIYIYKSEIFNVIRHIDFLDDELHFGESVDGNSNEQTSRKKTKALKTCLLLLFSTNDRTLTDAVRRKIKQF